MEAGNPIHLRSGLMKPGEGLAQILSKDKKLVVGKKNGVLDFFLYPNYYNGNGFRNLNCPKGSTPCKATKTCGR
jgi:hypothetical protein